MSHIPSELTYSRDHEWVRSLDNGRIRVGITDHAQKQLGDMVYVELPTVGARFEAGDAFGTVESVKSVSDLYMPVAGTIAAVNESLSERLGPEQINDDPYEDGWIVEVTPARPADLRNLLTAAAYKEIAES